MRSHYKTTYDLSGMLPPSSYVDRWPRLILLVSPDTGTRSRSGGLCTTARTRGAQKPENWFRPSDGALRNYLTTASADPESRIRL